MATSSHHPYDSPSIEEDELIDPDDGKEGLDISALYLCILLAHSSRCCVA